MAAAVSSSVRSAQKRSSATICLRTRRKRRSSASVSLASAADGHSEGQWAPSRLGGEPSWKAPSTLRPRAPWGWFWGWVPSCGWCSEAPWRAKSGGRRSDLRKLEVDRLRGWAEGQRGSSIAANSPAANFSSIQRFQNVVHLGGKTRVRGPRSSDR